MNKPQNFQYMTAIHGHSNDDHAAEKNYCKKVFDKRKPEDENQKYKNVLIKVIRTAMKK